MSSVSVLLIERHRRGGGLTPSLVGRFHARVPIRTVLFDYGGTLDGTGDWLARFTALYRAAGIDIPPPSLSAAFGRAEELAYGDPPVRQASLREVIESHVTAQLTVLDLHYPALHRFLMHGFLTDTERALTRHRALLETLAPRFTLGVVSNFYGNVERVLHDAGFGPVLSVIVDSSVVGMAKPDPRIFAHALATLGCAAADALHVGDSYSRDVVGARAAGIRTAWLAGDGADPTLAEADLHLRSLEELPAALPRLTAGHT